MKILNFFLSVNSESMKEDAFNFFYSKLSTQSEELKKVTLNRNALQNGVRGQTKLIEEKDDYIIDLMNLSNEKENEISRLTELVKAADEVIRRYTESFGDIDGTQRKEALDKYNSLKMK